MMILYVDDLMVHLSLNYDEIQEHGYKTVYKGTDECVHSYIQKCLSRPSLSVLQNQRRIIDS